MQTGNFNNFGMVEEKKSSNLLTGMVGALLGALIGGALWVAVYRFGYIAGLAGVVAAVCALKGYELLGGTMDVKGIVISIVMALVVLGVAHLISVSWDIMDYLNEGGETYSLSECFQVLKEMLKADADVRGEFLKELRIGYGLTAISSISVLRRGLRGK